MKQGRSIPEDLAGTIAITGVAGRFPGTTSLAEFWDAVCQGRDLIHPHPANTLADNFTDAQRAQDNFVPVRPSIADADMFDASFFDMLPREAAQTDPQFRVFLETCWQALEDAGHDPSRPPGPIGVFGGASMSTYFLNNVMGDRGKIEDFVSTYQLGDYQQFMGALSDTLATRVAFRMGLTGPAVTVSTACSTSLVAVAQACQSLEGFHCDMALAGGVSITFPQERGYFYQEGGMVSHDGHCRPFDAGATGTVFGHGAGIVVLRRYEDALADGDQIYALIRGVGLNNDGSDKIAFTAPSVTGQAIAIAQAQGVADVDPDSIGYVECHGTGTPLGDPVEFEGLKKAFAGVAPGRVHLGSAKANIGHCDAAAGVVGLIKSALMLREKTLPPMANYTAPNPKIDLENSPFRISTVAQDWVEPGPLRAGVSALGVGGTNAHVVLEEALEPVRTASKGLFLLPLSAKTDAALAARATELADALAADNAPPLEDVAFTLQEGRSTFAHRHCVTATTHAKAIAALRRAPIRGHIATSDTPPVAFMFPGQGAQYPGMGQSLYAAEPNFSQIIRQGSAILKPLLDLDLKDLLYGAQDPETAAQVLRDTAITQPALYLVAYATARLWMDRGIAPTAMVGHSVGEFVAATLAGVMDFETGLHLIAARGRLMQDQPAGAMLSVRCSLDDVQPHLTDGVDIAGRNAPKLIVLAGPTDAISAMEDRLTGADIPNKRLHTSHAFHSAMMEPVATLLEAEAAKYTFAAPQIPYVSCVTGTWITQAQACDPAYWARHCRAEVNFDAAIRTLCDAEVPPVLLEVGPGRTLGAFAAQAVGRAERTAIIQSLPDHSTPDADRVAMSDALGVMWSNGVNVDWALNRAARAQRVSLPGYPFQKQRHWIDPPVPAARHIPDPTITPQISQTSVAMTPMPQDRSDTLTDKILALLAELSGDSFTPDDAGCTFLELGFDSLLLGQVTQRLKRDMDVALTFRQLMTEFPTVKDLITHLDTVLPPETTTLPPETTTPAAPMAPHAAVPAVSGDVGALMQAQTQAMLTLFDNQMRAMGGNGAAPAAATAQPSEVQTGRAPVAVGETTKGNRHDLNRRAAAQAEFTPKQLEFVADLCGEYGDKFPTSKTRAQEGRRALADPRTASGFRGEWKELVFPVIAETSKGARLTDPDGNDFVDLVNGFGQTAFGHAPDFVTQAVAAQMDKGFAIGPQTSLAHDVAEKFLSVTGHERVTFCNTGSEAVMAAMRLARTVTGRDTVVCFKGDYHGQFDEVLVKGRASGDPTALPAVAGVPTASVRNMVVLDYGSDTALDWIRDNIGEIAAVLIEPVQSRHPELRPRAFCEAVRQITADNGAALIMDEIVTGFRVARGGMQEVWGIQADMATYGKVVGGGMPVGVLSGAARFLDALDGGFWRFGDDSVPEVPPTFFAGTFVRHPLVLAALSAVLDHIDGDGVALYDRVAPRTEALLTQMNDILEDRGLPRAVTGFSSWLIVNLSAQDPRAALLYPLMRLGGVHVHDGYPWFFTTAHAEADFETVARVFAEAVDRLQSVGILTGTAQPADGPITIPLTEPQKEVWMAAQLGEAASGVFIESISLRLTGALDQTALAGALNTVISRHDALRLRFAASGEAAQVMPQLRLSLEPQPMDADALADMIAADASTPFDLTDGPLIRATLAQLADDDHVLVLTTHHIICDGWSTYLIIEELAALYNATTSGAAADLPAPVSFAEYASGADGQNPAEDTLAFWRGEFPAAPELPELPTDTRRHGQRNFDGATHVHQIDADLARAVKKAAGREGVTLFAALSGALAALLSRLSAAQNTVLAVPTAGQTLLPDSRLVGHCVNLLPISLGFDGDQSLRDHLKQSAAKVLDCFDHGDTTYGAILNTVGLRGDLNRQPLSEVQFNLDQQPSDFGFAGLSTQMESNPRAHTNFDLIFNVTEGKDGLRIDLTYATDILSAETVARWCDQYHRLLGAIADDMAHSLNAVPLLSEDDSAALAAIGNDTDRPLPAIKRADALITAQAQDTPDAVAIEDARGTMDYATLDQKSDRLAAVLQRTLPTPGTRVAVMIDRSADLVVALLAVMKAGHAYVPLDPHHPKARLRTILETADVGGLIHQGDAPDLAGGLDITCLAVDADHADAKPDAIDLDDPTAYAIFTSGSTGTPKGVEVSHLALLNLLTAMAERPGFTAADTLLSVTTVSFDIAALELFLPLITGGKVIIAAEDAVREAFPLVARLAKGDVTVLQATPTLWQMLIEAGLQPNADLKMLVGGEPLARDLADNLRALGGEVWNMYGPTETTIWSSCGKVDAAGIDIGQPIANTVMHVLDDNDQLCPIGVTGELNIGGTGLAQGYLGQPDLTATMFRDVDLPGVGAARLYRTGDLARRKADGSIELLGRQDGQVKLRGYRIELSEIEVAMRAIEGISAAAVDLRDGPAGPVLAAFYVTDNAALERGQIATSLTQVLPAYMVPSRYQAIDALPKTGNGKLDRKGLPTLDPTSPAQNTLRDVVAPKTDTERLLAEIWGDVLGLDTVGTQDNLFELGADSLSIFRIAARMLDRDLGVEARHLIQHPTIAGVATLIETQADAPRAPSLKDFRNGARRKATVTA